MNYNALPLVLLLAFAPFLQAMGDGLRHGRREVVSSSCCSWDLATCGSNVPTDYCNLSKSNCEVDCSTTTKAEFIDPATRTTCVPRWQGCTSSSLCCGASSCISLAGDVGLYMGCGLQGDGPTVTSTPAPTLVPTTPLAPIRPTRRPTTPRPTRSPTTPRPTKSPTTPRPTRSPTTPRPTRSPTTPRPTRSPTTPRPTKSPTSSTTPKPSTAPTSTPTVAPTPKVTTAPTSTPTVAPTPKITTAPTSTPTAFPTGKPTPVPNNAIFCCSWDLTTCGSNVPTDYCNLSKQNCERDCSSATQAEYIDPTTRTTCTPRWYGCSSTPCCGAATCVQLNGYRGCDLPAPTMAPTFTPPPTPAFITAAKSSERIIVPDPAVPLETSRQNCPHLDAGIVDWNAGSTWGGSVPTGGNVQIPANTRVVIRQSVAGVFGVITIPKTSELILGENASGITLDVGGMDVMGKLTAGSETCRLDTPVTITLYGSRPTDAVTNIRDKTYKGISVNGTLSLHGKRFYRTWTRLAKSVVPGDRVMMLQHQVNWQPGQEVILVTTAMKDSREWHQNEVKIVESVTLNPAAGVGAAVYLTTDITYTHVANNGYQAEVGLLTRTIKIQGAAQDSEPTDPDPLNCVGRDIYGNSGRPCANTELTGFGGHVMVYGQGKGYVEGVELFRMGQTNVLGRYPMHFHLLGDCADCYFRDSSVHRSFYRCVSIHGTNYVNVNENVAYDVTGFCYYLEDGVEHDNTISFNLAAHIHLLGPEAPWGYGQTTDLYQQSNTLTLPADVAASGFYITNVHNNVIGNAASGGWSGFAFPNLPSPIGLSKNANMRPSSAIPLTIDGNTAHSTGWWWYHAGAFYFGGSLYYNNAGVLEYNAGRDFNFNNHGRNTCSRDLCAAGDCSGWCAEYEQLWFRMTNTKAFLVPSVGLGSWSGRMEIVGFEAHDVGLSVEALAAGFWIDNMLAVCRTGHSIALPSGASAASIAANGFVWYDTDQQHIITNSMFRKCGYRSQDYNQYNTAADRGCANEAATGCSSSSAAFGFLTHSDQFNPEVMQGTRNITFDNCGRRFRLDYRGPNLPSTVSGRTQNWLDSDGSVSGLGVPVLIGSGVAAAGLWWTVDDEVVHDPQGPLKFIKQKKDRGLGHFRMYFDYAQHNQVGSSQCGNGNGLPCSPLGYMKHMGKKFSSDNGLPITANAELAGPVGGFSWLLKLFGGSPRQIRFELIEAGPDTPMLLSIAYPIGTSFTITANAAYCSTSQQYSCQQPFHAVNSMAAVRNSTGNTYHFSNEGLLTLRIIQFPQTYVGNPNWFLPKYADIGKWGSGYAIPRFERGGVLLPGLSYGPWLDLLANCPASASNSAYCSQLPPNLDPDVCPAGYLQTAYDACCSGSNCVYADGSSS